MSVIFPFLKPPRLNAYDGDLPYRLRDDFLSPAEFSFFKVLCSVIGAEYSLQTKVRLADIFFVSRSTPHQQAFLNKIDRRHLDFLVCEAHTMKPLLGIELDDASHDREARRERDRFLDQVFAQGGLPLLRLPAQRAYVNDELKARLVPILNIGSATHAPGIQAENDGPPLCPKCGSPMVLRMAAHGARTGEQFFGCRNFPQCRETISIPSAARIEKSRGNP